MGDLKRKGRRLRRQNKCPALAVGRGKNRVILGYSNLEKGTLANGQTIFNLASVSKIFTAGLIQISRDQGLLQLEDPINSFLPDLPTNWNLNIQGLVTHTSGLPRDLPGKRLTLTSIWEGLQSWEGSPIVGEYLYSNLGFALLHYVLEAIHSKPYWQLIQTYFLDPLQMSDSFIDGMTNPHPQNIPIAYGYNKQTKVLTPLKPLGLGRYGFGSIQTTNQDFSRFLQANLDSRSPLYSVFRACRTILLTTPQGHQLGMAWEFIHGCWTKNGLLPGYSAGIILSADQTKGSFALTNRSNAPVLRICRKIL